METEIEKALGIAEKDLRSCYTRRGIVAGLTHFQQYWARDSFFASLGATQIDDFNIAKSQLEMFLHKQRNDGMIPSQITQKGTAVFRLMGGEVVDGTALFIIAFVDFTRRSADTDFVEKHWYKLSKAVKWLENKDKNKDGLIEEGLFCNWADSVFKFGNVMYSNCCYYNALKEFSILTEDIYQHKVAEVYKHLAQKTKNAINEKFWLEERGYYADWVDFSVHKNFASDGNVLAMLWEIGDAEKAKSIVKFIESNNLNNVPMQTNYQSYNPLRIPFVLWPFSAAKYHNGLSWLWLGCAYAEALYKIGEKQKAIEQLEKISRLINENKTVHEIFTQRGKPVNSALLKSEHPFAWSAALFIKAVRRVYGV